VRFAAGAGITALVGPSGQGKTSTLDAVAGLLRPRAGRIVVGGVTLFDAAAGVTCARGARGRLCLSGLAAVSASERARQPAVWRAAGWGRGRRGAAAEP
jgi:ABC-type branched-subunit amino acid transport system ATPase component